MALALVPLDHAEEAYELLKNNSPTALNELFNYFEQQWLKRVSIRYWNVSKIEFRTNNFCECNILSVSFSNITFFLFSSMAQQV